MEKRILLLALICLHYGLSSQSANPRLRLERDFGAQFSQQQARSHTTYTHFYLPSAQGLGLLGNTAEEKAMDFWATFGSLFQVSDMSEVRMLKQKKDRYGNQHLLFNQLIQGKDVFGAEIILHFDSQLKLQSAGGYFVSPSATLATYPDTNQARPNYRQAARLYLQKEQANWAWKPLEDKGNYLLSTDILGGGKEGLHWVKYLHAEASEGPAAFQIFIDLSSGRIVEVLQHHCDALNRRLYNQDGNNLIWQEGNPFPATLNAEQQNILNSTAETYSLFFRSFGQDSYNNQGAILHSVYDASNLNCPNAAAGSNATFYCIGTGTDDIVGHEWAHVYTRNNNNLIYAWESGAINEAFSDIFGELVDLLNSSGNDSNHHQLRSSCTESDNTRWKMGEDATAFSSHIRDMWNPDCRNHPDTKTASNYRCSDADNGGVHSNSGVFNRFFSLLSDGGSLNGQNVNGIGLTKAAHIAYQAHANYITRTSNYHSLADALEMAANDLLGINLPSLTVVNLAAAASGQIITTSDLQELNKAILATEMRTPSNCVITPILDPNTPNPCTSPASFQTLFVEDWENGLQSWAVTEGPVNATTWNAKLWEINQLLPDGRPGSAAFGPNPFVGDCNSDLDNGVVDLKSPIISIPAGLTENLILRFTHYLSIEQSWDGGLLYLIRNGASPVYVNSSHFLFNAYNRQLMSAASGNDNPEESKLSFSGSNTSSTAGSWGESQLDLSSAGVVAGDDIQLVFRMSHDGCNGWLGWYVDDVQLGYCAAAALPVTFLDFMAEANKTAIHLRWLTAEEENNTGFVVERSSENDRRFSTIGWVAASGLREGHYAFEDQEAQASVLYYYRLKQVDADGRFAYSPVLTARLEGQRKSQQLKVYPNPLQNQQFNLLDNSPLNAPLELYHPDGRLLQRWLQTENTSTFELNELPAGLYYLRSGNQIGRLLKTK